MKSSGNEIAKILDTIQGLDTYTVISDFFAMSAIAVRNNVDFGREWQAYEDRYKAIVKKYNKNDLQAFVRALAVFQGWIGQAIDGQIEFRDFAGELYMDSGTSNGKAGIKKEKIHPHAFRHFFAKMFLSKTNDIITLADLLGHGKIETTRIYLRKSYDEQKREFDSAVTW